MRTFLLALLVVLACTFSLSSVSASSADWAAPSVDAWASELSVSELEARHAEFLMALLSSSGASSSSSSSGPRVSSSSSSSSSSTGAAQQVLTISVAMSCYDPSGPAVPGVTACVSAETFAAQLLAALPAGTTGVTIRVTYKTETYDDAASSSTGARRLLALQTRTVMTIEMISAAVVSGATDVSGVAAKKLFVVSSSSMLCLSKTGAEQTTCLDNAAALYPGFVSLASSPTFTALANTIDVSTLSVDQTQLDELKNEIVADESDYSNAYTSTGGTRSTNGGYYFLGAVVLLFAVISLVYMIVHKKPEATTKAEYTEEVAMAPVVAAPVAGSGVVVAEEQPLSADQQQMDYRSVFALKHNVLDKSAEQKAAEDEHNHNDVHFILHQ